MHGTHMVRIPKRLGNLSYSSVRCLLLNMHTLAELNAFGDDDYHPISKTGSNLTDAGSIGYMIVDSLDTLMLMGLDDEAARARSWIQDKLSFDLDGEYNTFEVRTSMQWIY